VPTLASSEQLPPSQLLRALDKGSRRTVCPTPPTGVLEHEAMAAIPMTFTIKINAALVNPRMQPPDKSLRTTR
jgi:hypothetical protein